MSGFALVQYRLEFALIMAIDAAPEQMRGPIGTTDLDAQFARALEQGSEWRGAFEHDVGG